MEYLGNPYFICVFPIGNEHSESIALAFLPVRLTIKIVVVLWAKMVWRIPLKIVF